MNFAQTLGVMLFIAVVGGLATLAFSDYMAYQHLFGYLIGALVFISICVLAYEVGFYAGKDAQWCFIENKTAKELLIGTNVPGWGKALVALLYVAIFCLWMMTLVLHPVASDANAKRQSTQTQQELSKGAQP